MYDYLKSFFKNYFYEEEQFAALFILIIFAVLLYFIGSTITPVFVSILVAYLLNGVMNFIYHADQIIVKENDKFSLTEKGQQWLFTDPVLAMSFGAVGAYSCILTELVPSLRNEKKYGQDFIRKGEFIAKGSYHTGRANYSWVLDKMKEYGIKKIADLGCGSADVIINFCKIDPNLSGVGIDISTKALEEADSRVKKNNLSDRIKLSQGDLYKPETFSESVKDVDAFNAIMVMHEFLRDGEDSVINMFKSMTSTSKPSGKESFKVFEV